MSVVGIAMAVSTASTQTWEADVSQTVKYDSVIIGGVDFSYNGATGEFTCLTTGVYDVGVVHQAIGQLEAVCKLTVLKNGTSYTCCGDTHVGSYLQTYVARALIPLEVNDILRVDFIATGGSGSVTDTDGVSPAGSNITILRLV